MNFRGLSKNVDTRNNLATKFQATSFQSSVDFVMNKRLVFGFYTLRINKKKEGNGFFLEFFRLYALRLLKHDNT